MPNATNVPLNIFFEHGFSVSQTSENGTIFLSRDKYFCEPSAKKDEEKYFFYNTKTGKVIDSVTLNVDSLGNPLGNPFALKKGDICFIKDFASGDFVRVNFLPQFAPLVAFRGNEVFCTAHMKWEEYGGDGKTQCGCALKGFPVSIRGNHDDKALSNAFGFYVNINPESENLITIEYIILNENSFAVEIAKRAISDKDGEHDKMIAYPRNAYIDKQLRHLPAPVYDAVIRILLSYIKKRYCINIEYKNFAENQDYITAIFESPYEPALFLLQKVIPEIREIDTKEPNCFNALCKKINFKPWRTFRRAFNASFKAFPVLLVAQKMGFSDKNILNEMLFDSAMHVFLNERDFENLPSLFAPLPADCEEDFSDDGYFALDDFDIVDVANEPNFVIMDALPEFPNANVEPSAPIPVPEVLSEKEKLAPLLRFYALLLDKRSERSVWSVIKRNVKSYGENHLCDIKDAAAIYFNVKSNIDAEIEKKILSEGLSAFNHNLLVNVQLVKQFSVWLKNNHILNKDIDYTESERALEWEDGGYAFRLVETPAKLFMLGQVLHNCVGGYIKRILSRQCLILYGAKNGEIRLCVEVRSRDVHQCRANMNRDPTGEDWEAFCAWKKVKRLNFDVNRF